MIPSNKFSPGDAIQHLQPELWTHVNKLHIRKIISEFAHELLIQPVLSFEKEGWGHYVLNADIPDIEYHFRARLLSLDHWYIDKDSLRKFSQQKQAPLDAISFILEFQTSIGISAEILPKYLEEICSTLYGSAYMHAQNGLSSEDLTRADYQQTEHAMMEGHPSFVANNGRIGFDAMDYQLYTPEANEPLSLIWIAGHESRAVYTGTPELPYRTLLAQELDKDTLNAFDEILTQQGLDPAVYVYMPVHPWQWYNKLVHIFAADIASRNMVLLGNSKDIYLAQQSIRTFFNISHPTRFYVKTALSILNMGFMRGLSPYYMKTTPPITEWIREELGSDEYLKEKGFVLLGEVATVGYRNLYYEMAADSPYKKMLATLWRESPVSLLKPGQRLMTMAALLHIDRQGNALLPALIRSSGLDTSSWLEKYLDCYLSPLLHCFYYHDMVFMPHGENLILILENNVPVRAIMKDITEEVAIMNDDKVLPENIKRLAISVTDEVKVLSIFTDVFDYIFRYIGHILVEYTDYPEEQFWELVADCITAYQLSHPQLEDKYKACDLFVPEFIRSCLNRLQIGNNQQMVDLSDPIKNLQFIGTLKNPVAAFKIKLNEYSSI
jgi:siderophore synthetase component